MRSVKQKTFVTFVETNYTIMKKLLCLLLLVPFFALAKPAAERPLIGISCGEANGRAKLNLQYVEAIRKGGGTPVLIPVMTDSVALRDLLCRLDGIVMSGGEDVAPRRYGETPHSKLEEVNELRDTYDFMVVAIARDLKLPMLGICRGEQLINVAFGGTLYQDIPSQRPDWNLSHRARVKGERAMHDVVFEANSQLAKMFGTTKLKTNSSHHQAVKDVAPGFRVVARAVDGASEGYESTEGLLVWGVQFHPEGMLANGDKDALNFFKAFVRRVAKRK